MMQIESMPQTGIPSQVPAVEPKACAGGCGFFAHTSQTHGYCCGACSKNTGKHGPHCERMTSAEQAVQAKVEKTAAKATAQAAKKEQKQQAKAEHAACKAAVPDAKQLQLLLADTRKGQKLSVAEARAAMQKARD